MSNLKNEQGAIDVKQKNVFSAPLYKHSSERTAPSSLPSTLHAGTCTASHPIAATLTSSFLDFCASNSDDTDIRTSTTGAVGPGSRYCIDASTWKKAVDKGIEEVPRVKLESTHEAALKSVGLDVLKKWTAEPDGRNGNAVAGRSREAEG
ncbi:hypothetical protein N0V83_001938 [Neocucurbitaria cava]|uniref:Uncharacterized protein n=1 Tax=Neocucurbitaria cava TaxID=798079 RepID=A0A9W8YD63_9PLEO|nr:hypothetical protein N0V83_001938 [Neocucurbitaria cava]